jgi:hypothetical protein
MYEPNPMNYSRSNEDIFSSPLDSMRYSNQMPYSSLIPPTFDSPFRNDSDFVNPTKYTSPLRRSYDALNDFADMHQSFPTTRPPPPEQQQQQQQQQQPYYRTTYQTQHQPQPQQQPSYVNQPYINPNIVYTNEYGAPMDHYQPNTFQGTGSNMCKYSLNFYSSIALWSRPILFRHFKKILFLYLIKQGVVDSIRKYILVIYLRSQTKYKKKTSEFYFQINWLIEL